MDADLCNEFAKTDRLISDPTLAFFLVSLYDKDGICYGSAQYVRRSELWGRRYKVSKDHTGRIHVTLLDCLHNPETYTGKCLSRKDNIEHWKRKRGDWLWPYLKKRRNSSYIKGDCNEKPLKHLDTERSV